MNNHGEQDPTDLLVRTRSALIDAIEALEDQSDAVIVIGAQAVYLQAGSMDIALAETTKDSDVALDPRVMSDEPRIEAAMQRANFLRAGHGQPGSWVTPTGIPVDLMVPETLAGPGGPSTRGARVPPHDKKAMRRARGLGAAVVDNSRMEVVALDPEDKRRVQVKVAGPAALLVAKTHKIWERRDTPHRLNDKDAHDAYRLLRAVDTAIFSRAFEMLLHDAASETDAREAVQHLDALFGRPDALGAQMAGRAEKGVGDPELVATAVALLADDLLRSLSTP